MTLTLDITPEMQRELAREAEIRGIAVATLATSILKDAVVHRGASMSAGRSALQVRAWIDSLAEFTDRIPAMEGETFSRGVLYQDHD
jgi:hypothetical protein